MRNVVVLLFLIATTPAYSQKVKLELPLNVKEVRLRQDSLDRIIWTGIEMPFVIKDTVLSNPVIKSKDIVIYSKDGKFFPSPEPMKKYKDGVKVGLYNAKGKDTILIKEVHFAVRGVPAPKYSIDGIVINNSVPKSLLMKSGKLDVTMGCPLDSFITWQLMEFDMQLDGRVMHSNSNTLTQTMQSYLRYSTGNSLTIMNDKILMVHGDNIPRCIMCGREITLEK